MFAIKEAETNKDVKNYKSFKKLPDLPYKLWSSMSLSKGGKACKVLSNLFLAI